MQSGTPNVALSVLDSLYQVAANMTGIVGLTPIQVAEIALVLFGLLVLVQVYGAITQRSSFSLDESETKIEGGR